MPDIVKISLSDLLVDTRNARLNQEQPSQQAAITSLAKQQSKRLLKLAADIVDHGLDPTTLIAVVPTDDQQKRYTVIEGNRRVVALKALETPSLVAAGMDSKDLLRLKKLASRYSKSPIESVQCVLFDTENEAIRWVSLRHTGQNEGVGLVEWGANEKDRFAARHGQRSPEGQILDFVERYGALSNDAKQSTKGILTSIRRLISNPEVRERLGISISNGEVASDYPAAEVAKGLTRIVEDLKTERVKVGDIYNVQDRVRYANTLPSVDLPDSSMRMDSGQSLLDTLKPQEAATSPAVQKPSPKKKAKKKVAPERTALIPKDCQLDVNPPRINKIYNELSTLSADQYPNACSVLLRVFLELSVDHFLEDGAIMTDSERRSAPLAKRLKTVASELQKSGKISISLETAVQKIADSQFLLAASTVAFNQYVHNQYIYPKATELRVAWDEMQPFMEKLWS